MFHRNSIVPALVLLCLGLQALPAATIVYDIQSRIDGQSRLLIQGNTVQWHNLTFTVPGKHSGDNPTVFSSTLNGGIVMNMTEWWPDWPGGTSGDQWSSTFSGLNPALPGPTISGVVLDVIAGRESLTINQSPNAGNGYQLILDFNDNNTGGSAWYEARVTVTTQDAVGEVPEPGSVVLFGTGLLLILLRRR